MCLTLFKSLSLSYVTIGLLVIQSIICPPRSQDTILEFIYDAYEKEAETLVVPDSIRMNKDMRNSREANALKAYRPRNRYREELSLGILFSWLFICTFMGCDSVLLRHFVGREDCSSVLEWIRSEGCKSEVSCVERAAM